MRTRNQPESWRLLEIRDQFRDLSPARFQPITSSTPPRIAAMPLIVQPVIGSLTREGAEQDRDRRRGVGDQAHAIRARVPQQPEVETEGEGRADYREVDDGRDRLGRPVRGRVALATEGEQREQRACRSTCRCG